MVFTKAHCTRSIDNNSDSYDFDILNAYEYNHNYNAFPQAQSIFYFLATTSLDSNFTALKTVGLQHIIG